MSTPSRRSMLLGGVALAGFAALPMRAAFAQEVEAEEIYGPVKDEPYPVKGIDVISWCQPPGSGGLRAV